MKKYLIYLALITVIVFGQENNPPFIGKSAVFSFIGGNAVTEYIKIYKNGHTEIGVCGKLSCNPTYRGEFKKILPGYDHGDFQSFYKFLKTDDEIYYVIMVSKKGETIKECNALVSSYGAGSSTCIEELLLSPLW